MHEWLELEDNGTGLHPPNGYRTKPLRLCNWKADCNTTAQKFLGALDVLMQES